MSLTRKTTAIFLVLAGLCLCLPAGAQTLVFGFPHEPAGLDPSQPGDEPCIQLMGANIYEALFRVDGQGLVAPWLAEGFKVEHDGRRIEITLRKGVVFHNGEPFTAQTAAANMRRLAAVGLISAQVNVLGPLRLELLLDRPDPFLLYRLASASAYILPEKTLGPLRTMPVGTGPFRFELWRKGRYLRLERNKSYREPSLPAIDSLVFRFMPGQDQRAAALASGEIGGFAGYNGTEPSRFQGRVTAARGRTRALVVLNPGRAPLADERVRRLAAQSLDPGLIAREVLGRALSALAIQAPPVLPVAFGSIPAEVEPDLKAAARELAAMGISPELTVSRPDMELGRPVALMVVRALIAAGFKPRLLEPGRPASEKGPDVAIIIHHNWLELEMLGRNPMVKGLGSPEMEKNLGLALAAADMAEAEEFLARSGQALARSNVVLPLFTLPAVVVTQAEMEGLFIHPLTLALDFGRAGLAGEDR